MINAFKKAYKLAGIVVGKGGEYMAVIANYFASWFTNAASFITWYLDGVEGLYQITGGNRPAQSTPVLDFASGGTIELEIDELDYPVVFTGIDSGGVGVFISHTYSTDKYILTPPTTFVGGKIKMWNVDLIQDKLGSELVTNGDFATDSDWVKGTGVTISGGRLIINTGGVTVNTIQVGATQSALKWYKYSFDILNYSTGSLQIGVGFAVGVVTSGYKSSNGTYSGYIFSGQSSPTNVYITSSPNTNLQLDNVSVKQINLTQDDITSTDHNQIGVVEILPCEEHGTKTDCDSTYSTLLGKKGLYNFELVGVTFPEIRTHDSSIYCDANEVGYSEGENLLKWSEDISKSSWVKLRSTVSCLIIDNYNACGIIGTSVNDDHAVRQSLVTIIDYEYIFSCYAKKGNKDWFRLWNTSVGYVDFDLANGVIGTTLNATGSMENVGDGWYLCSIKYIATSTGDNAHGIYAMGGDNDKFFIGDDVTVNTYVTNIQVTRTATVQDYQKTEDFIINKGTWIPALNSSQDINLNNLTYKGKASQALEYVAQNCLLGDGTASLLFANLPTYDESVVTEDGVEAVITITTNEWTPTNLKKYNDVILKNSGAIVARFPLNDYDSGTSPSSVIYSDVMGTGATLTLQNGTLPDNLSDRKGISWNTEKGFNYAVQSDGVDDYIDTGINCQDVESFTFIWQYSKPIVSTSAFGSVIVSSRVDRLHFNFEDTGSISLYYRGDNIPVNLGVFSTGDIIRVKLKSNQTLYVNDVLKGDFSGDSGYLPDLNFFMFARNYITIGYIGITQIYAKINDTEFFPQSDGTLKDQNGTVYTNQGTGDLSTVRIPASYNNPTEDIAGVELRNPPINNGKGGNDSEQEIKAIDNYDLREKDADNVFLQADGTPIEQKPAVIDSNDYIDITKDSDNNVYELKIK